MRDVVFRLLLAIVVLTIVWRAASAQEASQPQTSQWVLTVPRGNTVWNPGVYPTEERCRRALRAFIRSTGWSAKCAELLSP